MKKKTWLNGRRREPLPIDPQLDEIVGLLNDHQVVVVEAETGAGKTTRLPQCAALAFPGEYVTVTQPRRAAVRWNARRVAEEMGTPVGGLVGYRLSREAPVVSSKTRILFRVDQSLVARIRKDGRLPRGVLIIDEAHERSVQLDLLLGLVKQYLPVSPETRVLVTSATIDTRKFSEFFGGVPVVSVAGRCYPVSTEVVKLGKYEHHTQGAARAASTVLKRFLEGQLEVPDENGVEDAGVVKRGTVLVLLPGKEDIESVVRTIRARADELQAGSTEVETPEVEKLKKILGPGYKVTQREISGPSPEVDRVEILSCHGESTPQEQDAVQAPLRSGTLRIVCGTEVLRSSVTVRETVGVVDSLQVKRLITDAKGVAHLTKVAVSKAEADQAKGRAGRTAPGFYIPVSFESEYERLAPYPQPAILREPISSVVLQVAAVGLSVRTFSFIDPPPAEKVEVAIRRLKALGALDEQEAITEMGRLLVQFPLDPERAKVLVTADKLGVLSEAVIVTASLEAEGFFHRSRPDQVLTVDEGLLRLVLAHCEREWNGDFWKVATDPGDPSAIDLSELPDWVTPRKDGRFDLQCGSYNFPHFEGARWVAHLIRGQWAGVSQSDFTAIVRAYRAFKAEERRLKAELLVPENGFEERHWTRKEQEKLLRDWCFARGVNLKRLRMAEQVMQQIREDMASSPLRLANGLATEREFDTTALTKALASGLVDNLARRGERFFNGRLGQLIRSDQSVCPRDCVLLLTGGVRKVPGRRGRQLLFADINAPVKPEWLAEVAPQLYSRTRQGDHHYDLEQDTVVETEVSYFQGDLELERLEVESAAAEASRAFSFWLASRRELPEELTETAPGLDVILRSNTERQERARQLNIRTGEETFKVYSQDEVFERFVEALSGARRIAEVTDPEALALPALDEEQVDAVLQDNPDTIELLGRDRSVHYSRRESPVVEITKGEVDDTPAVIFDLPDDGVYLPSGRPVKVSIFPVSEPGYRAEVSEIDIPRLRRRVCEHLNHEPWESWTNRPRITIPDPEDENSEVPFVTAVYGQCVVTGVDLLAYGTVATDSRSRSFVPKWYRDREEAEQVRAKAEQKLEEIQAEARQKRELEAARAKAEEARRRLKELMNQLEWPSDELRRRYTDLDCRLPSSVSVAELGQHQTETEALITEVEAAIEAERHDQEELAVIMEKIASDDLREARLVRQLAELAQEQLGDEAAAALFEGELNAPYGRVRRQGALACRLSGLGQTEAGETLLGFSRASDLNTWLEAVLAWLESRQVESGEQPSLDALTERFSQFRAR